MCASLVRGIQNFHMDVRKYEDMAYNFMECPHGYTFEGRGLNVVNAANGTNPGNQSSHAICSLAGQGNAFTLAEKTGVKGCVKFISERTPAPNKCIGHRDHHSTECPGAERYTWVHAGMPLQENEEDEMKTWFVRSPAQQVYVFDGVVLREVDSETYYNLLKMYGTQGDPWQDWSQEQIDAVPKVGAS